MATRPAEPPASFRFGDDFELDLRAYQLRSAGIVLKLKPIPLKLLTFLIERQGELVTREQIVERIWGKGIFLDSDNSINSAISKIRQVLRDNAEKPRFVETVTGRGYRFIAPVAEIEPPARKAFPAVALIEKEKAPEASQLPTSPVRKRWPVAVGVGLAVLIAIGIYLRWIRSGSRPTEPGQRLMLAVLPFENLTGDPGQDYFSDGLTEEMITQLGSLDPQRLGIIARTSVMHYKHSSEALNQIGSELRIQYVLEGSVRRDGGKMRITAQLIQVKDQSHLWAREYDRESQGLLALQGEIAQEIADEIQLTLEDGKPPVPSPRPAPSTTNYEAYDLYLRGRFFLNKRNIESLQQAITYFQQAVDKDPSYARAYADLADCYALLGGYTGLADEQLMAKARAAAQRALQLDNRLPEAHTALALIVQNYDHDWQTAEKEFRTAIELDPNYATGHHWYAEHLVWRGRFDEAFEEIERARQLDPLSLIIAADKGAFLYFSRDYDRSIAQFRSVLELDPNFSRAHVIEAGYIQKGMFAEALSTNAQQSHDSPWYWTGLAVIEGRSGHPAEAQRAVKKLQELGRHQHVSAAAFAAAYMAMGENDKSLDWLEKACAEHSNSIATLKVEPQYDPLRSNPRFQALLRRVGLD